MMVPFDAETTDLGRRRDLVEEIATAGIDHVAVGDHVSFFVGFGVDGLILASSLLSLHPTLPVATAVYLLPLRHPVPVARQVATIAQLAPGRLVLGVGVGGEDRHEVEVCGVDPSTRGRRMDESLVVLRQLLRGESTSHEGAFFSFTDALVVPAPDPPVPILIGGRSPAALRRCAALGDGWLGIWVDAERYAASLAQISSHAADSGRTEPGWQHGLTVWCGFGDDPGEGRSHVAPTMESVYGLPFERFARYAPVGTPEDVADFLQPFATAGCSSFTLIARGASAEAAVAGVAEVRSRLRR